MNTVKNYGMFALRCTRELVVGAADCVGVGVVAMSDAMHARAGERARRFLAAELDNPNSPWNRRNWKMEAKA